MYICSLIPYSSRKFGDAGPKGLGRGEVYAMYSMNVTLWLRQEQGYLSAQASTDRKAGRLSLPFYSIEFFGCVSSGAFSYYRLLTLEVGGKGCGCLGPSSN